MSYRLRLAFQDGWEQSIPLLIGGTGRRIRNKLTARRLKAPGFRAGRHPRLLRTVGMHIGVDFHAGDNLWMETIGSYAGEQFSPVLTIGENATLSDSVHIACINRVTIGSGLLCGSRVIITDHSHGSYGRSSVHTQSSPTSPPIDRKLSSKGSVVIGQNVWIGDGVAILPGARIGHGCVIGANAVVTGTIPDNTIAVGMPARPVGMWSSHGNEWLSISTGKIHHEEREYSHQLLRNESSSSVGVQ